MRHRWLPTLVLSPSLLLVGACVYGFIAFTVVLSFTSSTILPLMEWSERNNYERLFGLSTFALSARNLGVFAALYVGLCLALGLLLAILIDQKIRAENVFRSIFLYPMALSFIVTGTAWKWLLDPGIGLERTTIDATTALPNAYYVYRDQYGRASNALPLTLGWQRDGRDSVINPTLGRYQRVNLELSLAGDVRYLRSNLQFQQYWPVANRVTFGLNAELDALNHSCHGCSVASFR